MSMLPQHFLDNTFPDFERWNQRPLWLWWHLIVDYEWFQRRGFVSNFLSFNFWWQSWRTELEQIGQNSGLPAALEAFNPLTIFNRYFLQLSRSIVVQNLPDDFNHAELSEPVALDKYWTGSRGRFLNGCCFARFRTNSAKLSHLREQFIRQRFWRCTAHRDVQPA